MTHEIMKDLDQKALFHVFFLKNDEEETVKIDEVEDIDFDEIKTHLERGESIFITHTEKNLNSNSQAQQQSRRRCKDVFEEESSQTMVLHPHLRASRAMKPKC